MWLYHVFSLSLRDVELLLAERGVIVSYESVRRWCLKFGRNFADKLRWFEEDGATVTPCSIITGPIRPSLKSSRRRPLVTGCRHSPNIGHRTHQPDEGTAMHDNPILALAS